MQLQEIQARLKLKKLQKARVKEVEPIARESEPVRQAGALLARASSSAAVRSQQDRTGSQTQRVVDFKPSVNVHVPVSPNRRVQSTEPQRSPGRVLLGIDKGLKGSDVSLRRAPSLRNTSVEHMTEARRTGGYLQRATSQASMRGLPATGSASSFEDSKPRTFSERMADVRTQEADRRETDARIKRARSKAFDIDTKVMENLKAAAEAMPEMKSQDPEFSREQIVNAYSKPTSGLLQRSKSTTAISSGRTASNESRITSTTLSESSTSQPSSKARKPISLKNAQTASSEFETFSSLHLSKRIIPHTILTRTLAGKKIYTIPDLLKVVKAPHWRLPDVEEDIVLLAVIAAKSEPRQHKAKSTNEERGKYMVMTLTDLKWELDLFLFNTGFDKFWKLSPGTVVAILNPSIMPPMHADTGRFSMTLNSDDDTVLEIGAARDLGFCKSVKKDGKTCDAWIDKRRTEYCEFHINESLKKTTAGRMEVNTMNFGKKRGDGWGNYGARKFNSKDMSYRSESIEKPKNATRYDKETGTQIYIAAPARQNTTFVGGPGRSSASLLDDPDVDPDAFHRGTTKEERMRRQLATVEKEKNIAEKLSMVGGGLGADYMRTRSQPAPASSDTMENSTEAAADAAILALLGSMPKEVHLSPIKRKRSGMSSTSTLSGSAARGWGAQLTKELGRMKDGERLQPVKKKTRFVTAKGIREAGRESFGGEVVVSAATTTVDNDDDDDDDDDLDIVK